MQKIVKNGNRTTTVTLNGGEYELIFSQRYNVFSVKSVSDIFIALESGKASGDDDVMICKAGESIMYPRENLKLAQYPNYYKSWSDFPTQYGKRVHDCVGLIKGYLWSENSTSVPKYNGSQDVSANGMRSKCTEKGDINTMPDIPGVLVFMDGHVGVYIGGGEVIEARGHEYGVVKTKLSERPWKWWGKCPWLSYESVSGGVKIKPGTWYVRKGAGTNFDDICIVCGGTGEEFVSSKTAENGWRYLDKFGGWISSKAIV